MPDPPIPELGEAAGQCGDLPCDVAAATLDAILRRGIDAFTLADVSELTGIHELTICDRWGDKSELAVRTLIAHHEQTVPLPDTGYLRDDMVIFTHSVARFLSTSTGRLLMRLLVVDDHNWGADDTRAEFWRARFQRIKVMFDRAEQRGEIPPGINGHIALQLMVAPLHAYALYLDDIVIVIDEETVDAVVDMAWRGVASTALTVPRE